MQKKLFVLGAGILQIPVIKKAQEMGVYVIVADDDPNAPGMVMADKAIVPGGLMNEEKLVAIAMDEQIDGVFIRWVKRYSVRRGDSNSLSSSKRC